MRTIKDNAIALLFTLLFIEAEPEARPVRAKAQLPCNVMGDIQFNCCYCTGGSNENGDGNGNDEMRNLARLLVVVRNM